MRILYSARTVSWALALCIFSCNLYGQINPLSLIPSQQISEQEALYLDEGETDFSWLIPVEESEKPLLFTWAQEAIPSLPIGGAIAGLITAQSGLEAGIQWQPASGLSLSGSTQFAYGRNPETALPQFFSPRASDWITGIDISWEPFPNFNFVAQYQWVGELVINTDNQLATLGGYFLGSLAMSYTLGDWSLGLRMALPRQFTNDSELLAVDDSAFGEFFPAEELLVAGGRNLSYHASISWSF